MKKCKHKRDKRKIIAGALACLLAGLMLLSMLTMVLQFALATDEGDLRSQISDLKNSASSLESKRKSLANQLSALKNNKKKALAAKELLDQEMASIEEALNNIIAQIFLYDQLITQEGVKLAEAQEQETAQYELFCQRVRAMEETGTVSYWSILFSAKDFSDLLDRATLISEIMEYDNAVAQALTATRQKIADTKTELELAQAEQEEAREQQEAVAAALEEKINEAAELVEAIESQESEYAEALEELKEEEARVDKLIAQRQAELEELIRKKQIQFDPGSGYYYPLPSSHTRISSPFGYRRHPVTGKYSNHNGIDLPAPRNTKIYAIRGGVVSISGYSSSYGNYVVVQHDGGISSLYAHMNSRAVKVNDIVKQGQVIGYVGTTGSSTGNHLHLEIRENGVRVNPVLYYPSVKFTYS